MRAVTPRCLDHPVYRWSLKVVVMCRTPGIGYGAKAIDCYDVEEKKKIFFVYS